MKDKAVAILEQNRVMAVATVRPDGWPQTTLVGYANEDVLIYFMISRASQKFENISRDDRVSIAIGADFHDPATIKALSIAAHVSEVRDPKQRSRAIELLTDRHPGLKRVQMPDDTHSAVMRAYPAIITILDYSKGFGHADQLTMGPSGVAEMKATRADDWGYGSHLKHPG
ncbi:pyridoxamine 5'-phosphate oxidase family protein [Sphingomonas sp.]|jgi:nitroimidazol reductase NimA-like FMN-containing flavoprotein (pyridoxamine 5'-phosphate oxidase superfamily)|uniref:pyridoxamine 5'-phosphate oxidase family protein n=1 Tax=Sphingomonas sp. TaxID=28214 RepID=UPI0025FDB8D8|nr:pyridoxamine 5'-phosphate oxidase family protein [Sphingomonas sp.]